MLDRNTNDVPADMTVKDAMRDAEKYGFATFYNDNPSIIEDNGKAVNDAALEVTAVKAHKIGEEYTCSFSTNEERFEMDSVVKITFILAVVTVVAYGLTNRLGKMQPHPKHKRLLFFWNTMVCADMFGAFAALLMVFETLFSTHFTQVHTCVEVHSSDMYVHTSNVWLLIWVVFTMSMLRSVSAITSWNSITNLDKIQDLLKGIALLTIFLIYLIPIAVLMHRKIVLINLDGKLENVGDDATVAICTPGNFFHSPLYYLQPIALYLLAIAFAWCSTCNTINDALQNVKANNQNNINDNCSFRQGILLVVLTHFIPMGMICAWIVQFLGERGFLNSTPIALVFTVAANSLSNLFCYKLFIHTSRNDDENYEVETDLAKYAEDVKNGEYQKTESDDVGDDKMIEKKNLKSMFLA